MKHITKNMIKNIETSKILNRIILKSLALTLITTTAYSQVLTVMGEAGHGQIDTKAKAYKCEVEQLPEGITLKKNSCKNAFILELNTPATMEHGFYLVGYSNTIYPGIIEIKEGTNVELKLEKLIIPSQMQKKKFRIYRDFSSLVEQKKILISQFGIGKSFFKLSEYEFGDYYIRYAPQTDIFSHKDYSACSTVNKRSQNAEFAQERANIVHLCDSFEKAKTFMDYIEMFKFAANGKMSEMWVRPALDLHELEHKRHLVALPLEFDGSAEQFVSVFPGAYKISSEGSKPITVNIKIPETIVESYGVEHVYNQVIKNSAEQIAVSESSKLGLMQQLHSNQQEQSESSAIVQQQDFSQQQDAGQVDPLACDATTKLWKTELRAYCEADDVEGCNRYAAKVCVDMRKLAPKTE